MSDIVRIGCNEELPPFVVELVFDQGVNRPSATVVYHGILGGYGLSARPSDENDISELASIKLYRATVDVPRTLWHNHTAHQTGVDMNLDGVLK